MKETVHTRGEAPRILISGGGTGGHIFPALSIAGAARERWPGSKILFVGAEDRMEMERVPAAGYDIIGLPVAGFDRRNLLKNISVTVKLCKSMRKARRIVDDFRPHIAVGVGGYASGPTLRAAAARGVPTLLQEQNSLAGVTNRLLARRAAAICVAYEGMERFFPKEKIILTGNPCRHDLVVSDRNRAGGYAHFRLDPRRRTLLMLGGSLGARTLNRSIIDAFPKLAAATGLQVIWQCGRYYLEEMQQLQAAGRIPENVHLTGFVSRMDYACSVADLIISRAGAGSLSEFSLLGRPVILVPSPNVAEDHQTKNAQALVDRGAAVMIRDADAPAHLFDTAIALVGNDGELRRLATRIAALAQPDAARRIVDVMQRIIHP
ncbi:MAG: undecaprenyldiphospho-muramoylpentapeptide beta-N-acetylglucosaminyltransferase [Proteiniphilum sp.]|jgi:UDP-N-acetylglucosamine--N-acetylmuramyl-(pentapeptide) pyrophosphoryl-undecaprenol N-acetylglucosamine transferase|nr:undecaprenyldiphospho-muramoylpentapeptide beta-N-acetylglucosaminyltransferase [Proteiniphilum sp.]